MNRNRSEDDALCELLTRFLAGGCTPEESRALSARIENEPAASALLAELLMQGVAVHEWGQTHPIPAVRAIAPGLRRSSWRWAWPPAVAATLALAAVLFWWHKGDTWTVRVVETSGSIRWTGQAGGSASAGVVGSLGTSAELSGGTLETLSDDAAVTLAFRDGTQVTAMAQTVVTLSDDGQKQLHLRAGSLSADVKPQPKGKPLLIHTPTATLEVLGTRFDVESGSNATRLQVGEGSVRVTRLVDGSTIVVPAEHGAVASLSREDQLAAVERAPVVVAWSSDLTRGAKGVEGEWMPPVGDARARVRAQPRLLRNSSRGQVTIYRIGFQIPWEGLQTLKLEPEGRVRLHGRSTAPATIEVMLSAKRLRGGFAGNFFHQIARPAGAWQIELPVSAFRKERANGTEAPSEGLQLRHIAIYTIGEDSGLEIEQVEILRSSAGTAAASNP